MKKKTLKTLLLATALCAVTSVGAGVVSVNANADTALLSSDTFKTLGASIRLKTDELDTTGDGIRFAIGLEDSVYQSMLADGELDNINVMVMPTQLIQSTGSQSVSDVFKIGYTYEKDLNNDGTIEENEKAKPIDKAIVSNWTADTTVEAGKTYWIAYAYVYGIPGGSYDCDLTVRAYYLADGADAANAIYTDVTDKSTRSFAYVANAALNDLSETQDDATQANAKYIYQVEGTNKYSPYDKDMRSKLDGYRPTYTVKYVDEIGNVLEEDEVKYGDMTEADGEYEKTGNNLTWLTTSGTEYNFTSIVTSDLTLKANYSAKDVTVLTQYGKYVVDEDGAYNPTMDYSHALLDNQKLDTNGVGVITGKMVWKSNSTNWSGLIFGGTEEQPYGSYIFYITRKTGSTIWNIADPIYIGFWKSQNGTNSYANTGMTNGATLFAGPSTASEVDVTIDFAITITLNGTRKNFTLDYSASWGGQVQKTETWTTADDSNSWKGTSVGFYAEKENAIKFYDVKTQGLDIGLNMLSGSYVKTAGNGYKPTVANSNAVLNNVALSEDGTGVITGKMVWKSNSTNWSGLIFGGTEEQPYGSYIFYITRKTGSTIWNIADPIYIGFWKSQNGTNSYANTGMTNGATLFAGPSTASEVDVTIDFTITITMNGNTKNFSLTYSASWDGQVKKTETWTTADQSNSWKGTSVGLYSTQANVVTYYNIKAKGIA